MILGDGGRKPSRNVLGQPLANCSSDPLTGFFRNGCCDTAARMSAATPSASWRPRRFWFFPSRAAMICRRRCRPSAFRAQGGRSLVPLRAALAGGLRVRRRAPRRATGDARRRTRPFARSPISSAMRWTYRELAAGGPNAKNLACVGFADLRKGAAIGPIDKGAVLKQPPRDGEIEARLVLRAGLHPPAARKPQRRKSSEQGTSIRRRGRMACRFWENCGDSAVSRPGTIPVPASAGRARRRRAIAAIDARIRGVRPPGLPAAAPRRRLRCGERRARIAAFPPMDAEGSIARESRSALCDAQPRIQELQQGEGPRLPCRGKAGDDRAGVPADIAAPFRPSINPS